MQVKFKAGPGFIYPTTQLTAKCVFFFCKWNTYAKALDPFHIFYATLKIPSEPVAQLGGEVWVYTPLKYSRCLFA